MYHVGCIIRIYGTDFINGYNLASLYKRVGVVSVEVEQYIVGSAPASKSEITRDLKVSSALPEESATLQPYLSSHLLTAS